MKKLLVFCLLVSGITSYAQSVDDIIKAHLKAIGGIEKWDKLRTLKMVGKVKKNGTEMLYLDQVVNGESRRNELSIGDKTNIEVIKTNSGWTMNGISGESKPKDMSAADVKKKNSSLFLMSDLADYKRRGHKVEIAENEKVDDVLAIRLKLTKKDGGVDYYYLDPKSYLIIKYSTKEIQNGKEVAKDVYYSNYSYVAMVRFPHSIITKIDGSMVEDKICAKMDANIKFIKDLFDAP